MVRVWNAIVAWLWYALGCPPRFPLRQVRRSPLWDVCDYMSGRVYVVVPSRTVARAVVAAIGAIHYARTGVRTGARIDYARRGDGWVNR